jgi:hypothetical protein
MSARARAACVCCAAALLLSPRLRAQNPIVSIQTDPAPGELADPIEALMASGGSRVAIGSAALDFWWVKSLPLTPHSSGIDWSSVDEGTLVGAVRLSANYRDIRGKTIKPGIYTLRYALQLQSSAHTGTSPTREFLLIAPAAIDSSTAAIGHDQAVALARQTLGASDPASWSLDPPVARGDVGSIRANGGQKAVLFSVSTSREGRDAGVLEFGLVLVGTVQP